MSNTQEDILQHNEDRINRYLFGEMTADEEAVFESELQQNKTLKEQAEAIAQMVKAMDVVGKEHDKELITRMKSSASVRSRIRRSSSPQPITGKPSRASERRLSPTMRN